MDEKVKQQLIEQAQLADAERASKRSIRKTLTKELKDLIEFDSMLNYSEKIEEPEIVEEKEWDVPIGEPIYYFDPELSYEITGYRPITKDKGLDFDPKVFTIPADTYRRNGRYTNLVLGTFAHRNYWTEEFKKCQLGYTVGKYRLTGENYFFLNYYRLLSVLGDGSGGEIRSEDFPGFFAKQYEYFHYLEMIRKTDHDGLAFKSRGIGCSEIAASNLACQYCFHQASYNIVAAFDEKYVTQTLSKVWLELDFLNTSTEGAFRRVRMKVDTQFKKRASVVDTDGNESGWMSTIEGVTVDNPRKLRGNRVNTIYFEEAGSNPKLIDTYVQSTALVDILGYRVGCRVAFGTGGDNGAPLTGLKTMFYNPEDFTILPYKNQYNRSKETVFTGFFIPSYTLWFGTKGNPGYDSRGVVDEERAKEFYIKRWEKIKNATLLMKDKAEFCFTPEDAFIMEGSNAFNAEKLAEQLVNIENKVVELPKEARLKWSLGDDGKIDRTSHPIAEYGTGGILRIVEPPILDDSGIPYLNLYVAGCLTPGEKVQTINGLKNCEDITLDDTLFSITGKPAEIKNIQQYYKEDEDIYTFKLNNIFRTTTFTKEHPIYCCTEHLYRTPHWVRGSRIPYMSYSYDFKFKKASEVKAGDFVKVPNIYLEEKSIPFEKWDNIKVRIDRKIENPLANPDFWWLIGLLIGDGWACKNNREVSVVFNRSEQFYITKCRRIVTDVLHRSFTVAKSRKSVEEYLVNSTQLNQFITNNFGRGARNKHLSEWVKYLPKELKINLVLGYLASDGCICPSKDSMSFVSCSYQLLEDFQDIFFSLGIINTVHWLRSSDKYYSINNRTKLSHVHEAWTLDVHGDMINKFKKMCSCSDLKLDKWQDKEFTNHAIHRCFFEDESLKYIYIKICKITRSRYTGIVYNYHCDTSTFMCKYIPTHNCDSIDTSSDTTTGQSDLSLFCVVIYRRLFGLKDPKIVALYKYRPKQVSDAYDEALKLCQYYNAKMLVEASRVGVIEYFKRLNMTYYLMRKPHSITSGKNAQQYGSPATVAVIEHNLQLINDYVENYYTQINYLEVIDELTRYSFENKRKFDIVAALGFALLADEELGNKLPRESVNKQNLEITQLCFYKNAYGQIEFGVRPKNTENYGELMNYGRY